MKYNDILNRRIVLKEKFRNRKRVFGGWLSFSDPSIAETLSHAQFDFIGIDMEHTTISLENARNIIVATQSKGVSCFPRPVSHSNDLIKPLLEAGADGIIIQMVETAREAQQLADLLKFPPKGRRSFGVNRAHGYGLCFDEYVSTWNDSSTLICQIESKKGVDSIDDIISLEEVDGVMIGPFDLSGSLGVPGQINSPLVQKASQKVIDSCIKYNKSCLTQISSCSEETIRSAFNQGFSSIIIASDLFVLSNWTKEVNKTIVALGE